MAVPRRSIQFLELGGGITIVALVCEDLARLDAVADLLRTVGPTLVLTVLLDGPQLASRWTARYASILADDPGSAVLTLTSFGMVERSRPGGQARPGWSRCGRTRPGASARSPSRPAPKGCCCRRASTGPPARAPTAGGRWTTRRTSATSVSIRWSGGEWRRQHETGRHRRRRGPDLEERELTVLSSWAEALAEASTADEVDAVRRRRGARRTWRAKLGVEPPSPALGAALDALTSSAEAGR